MHTYDPLELYVEQAAGLFSARRASGAVGGRNNIPERGAGPEKAVRNLVQSIIGHSFRVTHGHVVRADGRKSKQLDLIIVRDSPAATMYRNEPGGAELVRAEWVAAVAEVKSSWTNTGEVLNSYEALAADVDQLCNDLRRPNTARFGEISGNDVFADHILPITGRQWINSRHASLIVLDQGGCPIEELSRELLERSVPAEDSLVLVLDESKGGVLCTPGSIHEGYLSYGVTQTVQARTIDALSGRRWVTVRPSPDIPEHQQAGALLSEALVDLQLHLALWVDEHTDPRHYSGMGKMVHWVDRPRCGKLSESDR